MMNLKEDREYRLIMTIGSVALSAIGVGLFGVSTDWNWGLMAALFLLLWGNNISVELNRTR